MIVAAQAVRVVIALKPVDFRKGHDGLAALAEHELGLDPHSGVIVVFRCRRGDRIKLLVWDGSGLVMTYKRLEQGRFAWPAVRDGVIALVARPVRGAVRRAGLASRAGAAGPPACCGGMTHDGQ